MHDDRYRTGENPPGSPNIPPAFAAKEVLGAIWVIWVYSKLLRDLESRCTFIVSPLATLASKLCVVGDTGLKTGWVRCRHWAGWGGVVTYFADRNYTMLKLLLLSPGKFPLFLSLCK